LNETEHALPDPLPLPKPASGADTPPQALCASQDLAERGRAVLFDVLEYGRPARAFALRFDGHVVAYLNRCAHVPVEMDWTPGEFLDADREFIVCAIHGAHYHPATGRCAGGPCNGGRLRVLNVVEQAGQVHWYPSRDIQPAPGPAPNTPDPPTSTQPPP
jgi:nitrite reductase/ring-hydroxylating ferredoxin subunit